MMKLKIYTLLMALSAAWSLQSCDNNDDDSIPVPTELQNAFSSMYPNVTKVEWETKSGYYVADFRNGYEASAWFTPNGEWQMTETDIPYSALPQEVKASYEGSEYATSQGWKIDDVDKLERKGLETVYVIEVEKQNQEVDIYYSEAGVQIKIVEDTDGDRDDQYLPTTQLTETIKAFINDKYPGAKILEIDVEDDRDDWDFGFTEVDIYHDGKYKDVLFDKDGGWYSTSWDIFISDLSDVIKDAINDQYPNYWIDDAEYFEMSDGNNYYLIEIEGNKVQDKKIKITSNGQIFD